MDNHTENFLAINTELERRRAQNATVKDKETPFRCVFKTTHGHAYTYHETYDDALKEEYSSCGYSIMGAPYVRSARKTRIEIVGPRGGWKKYKLVAV